MGRSTARIWSRHLVPLAVVCAFTVVPPVQARDPDPGQLAARESVKELFRIETKGFIPFYTIAPDGKTLVYWEAVSQPQGKMPCCELVLIDLTTGKELHRHQVDYPMMGGVFSADGKLLAVGAWSVGSATIWDVALGEPKVQLQCPDGRRGCPLVFSPDGKVVAGLVPSKEAFKRFDLVIWDVTTGACRVLDPGETKIVFVNHAIGAGGAINTLGQDGKRGIPEFGEPFVGCEPVAASFAEHGGAGQLFVEYRVGHAGFTTLWDTARGKPLRTTWYFTKPSMDSMQNLGLTFQGAPVPNNSTMELLRFRTAPSGRILLLPRYNPPAVRPIPHDKDGTIALVVSPPAFENVVYPAKISIALMVSLPASENLVYPPPKKISLTELCRLEDYKNTTSLTCRLTPDSRRLVAVGIDQTVKTVRYRCVIRVWDLSALHPVAVKKRYQLSEAERERVWRGLFEDSSNPETMLFSHYYYCGSLEAAFSLVAHPDDAVPWLRKRMGSPFDWKKASQRIEELASADFETRETASRDLERMGETVRPLLERQLAKETDTEARRRIKELLAKPSETAAAYEVRQLRIIDVLEHIPTAAARELLKQIADGKYDPAFTEEAKQALQRATGKP